MEKCTLVKYFMNKIAVLVFLIIIFASCQTNTYTEYVRPDYTNDEILENEIDRIRENLDDNPIYSVWLAHLLYEETSHENAKKLFVECSNAAIDIFFDYKNEMQWYEALQIGTSLSTLNDFVSSELALSFQDDFSNSLNQVKAEYERLSLAKNTSSELIGTHSQTNDIATYITGVVTVWVDLGVRVEGGLGYPNRSLGSGFFIDERGYIITNHHVISELVDPEYEGYSRLYIKLSSDAETRIPARVVGWDETLDLALLKTEITPPYVYTLGSSQDLNIGNQIYAIGSPLGLENTITSGIISAFDRQLLSTAAVMQIDAAVNSGNSGGPLINTNGDVQGIVFAGLPTYQGLNFAIPVEYLRSILLRLYSGGEVNHSWIGAYGRTIKRYPSDVEGSGVEVLYVMPGSPSYNAQLVPGQIITAINGYEVSNIEELQFSLINLPPNSIVSIDTKDTIDSEAQSRSVYLDVRPEYPGLNIYEREPNYKMAYPLFGMELIPSSVGNRNQFTIQSIVRGSIADESGFSVHDPVEIMKTYLSAQKDAVFLETFTQKRKSGYFEISVGIGAMLDSPYIF